MADQPFKTRYVQGQCTIDYTPAGAVAAGTLVNLGGIVGVTHLPIAAAAPGALHIEPGLYDGAKDTSVFAIGAAVFWNATASPVGGTASSGAFSTSGVFAGYAALAALTGDATVRFRLTQGGGAPGANLPAAKYTTGALESATFPAGALTGANIVHYENTGATPGTLTTRTATQMFADTPNAQIGQSYELNIRNSSAGVATLTLGAGAGVTLVGTMTMLQNVTRKFVVTFDSATALTIRSMGVSAAGA